MINLLLEGAVACLLLLSIGYNWRLSRKIKQLQAGKADLEAFVQDFNVAILKAEHNITSLRELSQQANVTLREQINNAQTLVNDLSFLSDKGESVADTLEKQIDTSRDMVSRQKLSQQQPYRTQDYQIKQPAQQQKAAYQRELAQQFLRQREQQQPQPQQQQQPPKYTRPASTRTEQRPQQRPQMQPSANRTQNPDMPDSKRQALEAVMKEIAARKAESERQQKSSDYRPLQRSQSLTASKDNKSRRVVPDISRVLSGRRNQQSAYQPPIKPE